MIRKPELLLPAGSLEKLKTAILYGADAVYMGTPDMSLRTAAQMSLDDVLEGVAFAHAQGRRAYLTLNLFSHNKDIEKLPFYLETIRRIGPDGLIVADPGVFQFVRTQASELDLHISTQANVCSWLSAQFWQEQGAKLVVLGREVSFDELREIRARCPDLRLEAFIHGAMCMTYSGRCLLSNYLAQRGANQGNCANACRWRYKLHVRRKDGTLDEIDANDPNIAFALEEQERPGEYLPLVEDERGAYILNGKDLCLMPRLDDFLSIGIDSLKVEGRGRSAYYVGIVARAYRMAIDAWLADPAHWSPEPYMRELATVPNRGYSLAFHEGRLSHHAHNTEDTRTLAPYEYAGRIVAVTDEAYHMDIKNRIEPGDVLEFVPPSAASPMRLRVYEFHDVTTGRTFTHEGINAGQRPVLRLPFAWFHAEDDARLRRDFPVGTLVRKERMLGAIEEARLKLDAAAQKMEQGNGSEADYQAKRAELIENIAQGDPKPKRAPRLGADGCCGRGCNGCQHFWNDPRYEKARALLAQKQPGRKLTPAEAKSAREEN